MKIIQKQSLVAAALFLALCPASLPLTAQTAPNDPGWPRVFEKDGKRLTIYQPQVDYWNGYTNLHFHCAIAVNAVSDQEQYGTVEVDARTVADHAARVVAIVPLNRQVSFPNRPDAEATLLRLVVDDLAPPGQVTTLSLDRLLAYLDPATQPQQPAVAVNLDPPKIYYSLRPAVLLLFLGPPQFKPVAANRTDLLFALNSNWDILYDTASQRHFLLNGDGWLTAPDAIKGPWTAAGPLPASLSSLPANDNWVEVRKHIPGKTLTNAPAVFVATQPAELVVTKGEPTYDPIPGTSLMQVTDTDSVLFLNSAERNFYLLVAGRWFRAPQLTGPWSAASNDLPADFKNIPDTDPAAFVKASVPGTRQASEAVLLASVPTTTVVNLTNAPVQVTYNGQPQFQPIPGTSVQYAVNSPYTVLLADGGYYCCDQGVWFSSAGANGPWTFCTSVPQSICTIPPSSPLYNVTYVAVQGSSPTTVTYAQTSGYSGEYVAPTGVLMFGAGMPMGAAITNNDQYYYYPPYPTYYSYGCGALYNYAYGGYYNSARVYGPYGGAGKTAAYNPVTGTYSRSAYAYGPYSSAGVKQAYNPYTGGYAQAAQVNTAYGSAARGSAYNPTTGTYAQGAAVNTAAGSASRSYVQQGDQAAWGASRSSAYGSASAVKTTEGSSAAAWNTPQGQGAVAQSQSGNYYAAKDGTVYKKEPDGGWSSNTGSGWQPVSKPTPQTTAGATTKPATATKPPTATTTTAAQPQSASGMPHESMEYQDQARQYSNQQSQRTSQYRSTGGTSSGGRRR
jgi:hypothetical protein